MNEQSLLLRSAMKIIRNEQHRIEIGRWHKLRLAPSVRSSSVQRTVHAACIRLVNRLKIDTHLRLKCFPFLDADLIAAMILSRSLSECCCRARCVEVGSDAKIDSLRTPERTVLVLFYDLWRSEPLWGLNCCWVLTLNFSKICQLAGICTRKCSLLCLEFGISCLNVGKIWPTNIFWK